MKRFLILSASVFILNACASIVDKQAQMVTMKTPGAANAKCHIQNEDMKYVAYTDETIEIMKSPHDLVVHCMAPGNRDQTVHVKRDVNGWVFANVANGFVPGAAYDYFSRGAFDYPDTLTVSFVGSPVTDYPLPAYHTKDINPVHQHNKPVYRGPTVVQTDRDYKPAELKKKENLYGGSSSDDSLNYNASTGGNGLDAIHRQYNPVSSYDPTEEDK